MAKILKNERLSEDFYLMVAEEENQAEMGQFYMLRAWDEFPVLSRPISVFVADGKTVSFLYKAVGKGTEIFSRLEAGDEITLDGPHGNGYPDEGKKIALVGGGVGIAPLYLTAKKLKESDPERTVDIYLGFSGEPVMIEQYEAVADRVVVNVGGFITLRYRRRFMYPWKTGWPAASAHVSSVPAAHPAAISVPARTGRYF